MTAAGRRSPVGRRRGRWPPRRPGGRSPTGRCVARARSSSASSRSRDTARCAPRFVEHTACTSSMITVSTPRSDSRAAEVSSRNSDSGVVIRMSGGRRAKARRSSAGVSPERMRDGDVRRGQPEPGGGLADAGERRAQVAFDVDGERLERADVKHPAPAHRVVGRRLGGEPVQRREEGGERLARTGRRDDERVVTACDRLPRTLLGRRRRVEGAVQPGLGRGGELRHTPSLPVGSDNRPNPASGAGRQAGGQPDARRRASRRRSSSTARSSATSRRAGSGACATHPRASHPSRAIATCERSLWMSVCHTSRAAPSRSNA